MEPPPFISENKTTTGELSLLGKRMIKTKQVVSESE